MRTPIKHGTATFSSEPTQEQIGCVEKVAEYFYNKPHQKPKHRYHRFRFGLWRNIKVLVCRIFGHSVGVAPTDQCCGRCGLAYEEIYEGVDYYYEMQKWYDED